MNKFWELLSLDTQFASVSAEGFVVNAVILIALSLILAQVYRKCGTSMSNRSRLAMLFPLLALTTMMMIAIIKSSLALSLGLVGALSIIRFRSAIKEPEELAYIFLTIALGLGMGAGQTVVTILFFVIVMVFIVGRSWLAGRFTVFNPENDSKIYLEVTSTSSSLSLSKVTEILDTETQFIDLKRSDVSKDRVHLLFMVKLSDHTKMESIQEALQSIDKKVSVTFLNDEALFS